MNIIASILFLAALVVIATCSKGIVEYIMMKIRWLRFNHGYKKYCKELALEQLDNDESENYFIEI